MTDGQKLQAIGWWVGMRVLVIAGALGLVKLGLVLARAV